jgi:O-antigen ligase
VLAFLPPVLFLALGWFLNDPVALLASAVFSFFALLVAVIQGRANWLRGWGQALLGGLVLVYLVSTLVNGVSWASAFQGIYQRNFGLFFWIALALVFSLSASGALKSELFIGISLTILLGLASIYGLLQYFDKDPFPWRDPFDAVQLTLGNPNFSGAMLGMISVIPLAWVLGGAGAGWRVLGVLSFVVVFVLAIGSKSLQALVVMVIVVAAFILVKVSRTSGLFARVFKYLGAVVGALVVVGMPVLVFTNVGFLSGLRERFFFQGSITQRLDYWRTGFEIFRDYPWFGVGPDQFQRYAALYRTKEQIVRDGAFVIPDKAHSVLIDALANGGIFAGLLWSAFVILIFVRLIQTARMDLPVKVREQLAVVGAIWCGYVFQALISPDQLLLAVLGFMSAGLIVYLHKPQLKVPVKRSKFEFLFEDAIYARTFLLSIFAIAVVIWSQAISADMAAKKVLGSENLTRDSVLAAVNQWPAPKTTELIAIAVSQADSQCNLADELADRLIKVDERSAQGWYLKAICFNVNREFNEALNASENALKFDPLNPTYLVAKAKLGIASGSKEAAVAALAVIKSYYPDNPEISPLDSSISLMP